VGFKDRNVADLLSICGDSDERERQALCALAVQANSWAGGRTTPTCCPDPSTPTSGLRRRAAEIGAYEVQLVPEPMQD